MAILRPVSVSPTGAIDGNSSIVFSWQNPGDRQYFYQIQVYNNTTSALIYDSTKISSLNPFHLLPSFTLNNGTEYRYKVLVWNQNNDVAISDWIIVKCSSIPVTELTNVINNSEILNSSYLFQGQYTQAEGVPIRSWTMILYDINDYIINTTGVVYSSIIEYEFSGFNNETDYKIELQVRSQDNLIATTGKVLFHVRFEVPSSSIALTSENIAEKAAARLSWKVIQIIANITQGSILYLDNEKIDLTSGVVSFQDGMPNFREFNLKLWFSWVNLKNVIEIKQANTFLGAINCPIRNGRTEILRLKTPLGDIWYEWQYESETDGRFHVYKNFYGTIYHLFTPMISPVAGDVVYLGSTFDGALLEINTQIL